MADYIADNPCFIVNNFKWTGIFDALGQREEDEEFKEQDISGFSSAQED